VEVVDLEEMEQMEGIPISKVHQAAEVAAHSQVCSALKASRKQVVSPAVAGVGMLESTLISEALELMRPVPEAVAAVGELV
jgi:hypothetical protein